MIEAASRRSDARPRTTYVRIATQIEIKVQQTPQSRLNHVIVPASAPPREILLDGQRLTPTNASHDPGWRLNAATHTLHIFLQSSNFNLRIRL
jgi:hypothetical protein